MTGLKLDADKTLGQGWSSVSHVGPTLLFIPVSRQLRGLRIIALFISVMKIIIISFIKENDYCVPGQSVWIKKKRRGTATDRLAIAPFIRGIVRRARISNPVSGGRAVSSDSSPGPV